MAKNVEIARMTYPDGTVHEVTFHRFYPIRISGVDCYVAEYYDYTAGSNMITLITNYDNSWYKVPLDNAGYYYLSSYIQRCDQVFDAEEYSIGQYVKLAQRMDLDFEDLNDPRPTFNINLFVGVNGNGETWVPDTIYRSCGLISYNGTDDYEYSKELCSPGVIRKVVEGLRNYYINNHGVKEYDFEIDQKENVAISKKVKSPDGTLKHVLILLIPGHFKCKTYYSDFIDKEDYEKCEKADTINIEAEEREYLDLHDVDKVWRDGGNKKLPMTFDKDKNKGFSR